MIDKQFCEANNVYVKEDENGQWLIYYKDKISPYVYHKIARQCKGNLIPVYTEEKELKNFFLCNDRKGAEVSHVLDTLASSDSLQWMLEKIPEIGIDSLEDTEAPVINLINTMIKEACMRNASDIHIETFNSYFQVRYRIDGVMQEVSQGDSRLCSPLISRLKIMSRLDIAEKRLPQDGRFVYEMQDRNIDVRLSVIPVAHGERAVLRLLDQQNLALDFQSLGFTGFMSQCLTEQIHKPHGIILVTGPTGSGKSSTLYACVQQLNKNSRTILTIEDPIEYKLPGLGQTQVNSRIGMDFARGLRALLRQDPDVVMIGEIRDCETAHVAIQASLTGHLVFSTLHTNNAIGAIARLYDMGIEPWLISSSLSALLAQRLVRKVWDHCKQPYIANKSERMCMYINGDEDIVIYKAVGCDKCNFRGYSGRTGVYEIVLINNKMRELIQKKSSFEELNTLARLTCPDMSDHAYKLVKDGITSLEEVIRIIKETE